MRAGPRLSAARRHVKQTKRIAIDLLLRFTAQYEAEEFTCLRRERAIGPAAGVQPYVVV